MHVGGMLLSAGFLPWLSCTIPGFTAIIPPEPPTEQDASKPNATLSRANESRRTSSSGLLYVHAANTYEEYAPRTTETGDEELALIRHNRMPVRSATATAKGNAPKVSNRPSSGVRTDTFDAWSQHGMRALAFPAKIPTRPASAGAVSGSTATSTSLLKHAVPAAASVVEAAICHLMRLIANFCQLVPSILVTAPHDTERVDVGAHAEPPPSINGVQLLCDDAMLPKVPPPLRKP